MSKSKQAACAIVLLMAFGLLVFFGYPMYCYFAEGVYFTIRNDTPGVLTRIRVTYNGGQVCIAELEPGTSCRRRIRPSGESDLELAWFERAEVERFQKVDVYFEPSYRGGIHIVIGSDGEVSWSDETDIPLF